MPDLERLAAERLYSLGTDRAVALAQEIERGGDSKAGICQLCPDTADTRCVGCELWFCDEHLYVGQRYYVYECLRCQTDRRSR